MKRKDHVSLRNTLVDIGASLKQEETRPTSPRKSVTRSDSKANQVNKRAILNKKRPRIDVSGERFPFCIVWTPLPFVSWFIPTIGHTGIANSRGIIYDFSDDFQVSIDNFSFGSPTKYYQLSPSEIIGGATAWDKAIHDTSEQYGRTRHNFCFNNCHQYIAGVLNQVRFGGVTDWTQTDVWSMITFKSSYTNYLGFVRQWLPFIAFVIVLVICLAVLISIFS